MPPVRILVCGVSGRMGSRVVALAQADSRFALAGGVARESEKASFPILSPDEVDRRMPDTDAIIDFSIADASVRYAALAARTKTPIVVGSTGRTPEQEREVLAGGKHTALFVAANFSPGMNVLFHLAQIAAKALPDWEAAILDVHHAAKKDSPSGTAITLANAVQAGGGRKPQVASERIGDVIGDHTLTLAGPQERLELVHRAQSRDVFARGALEAALWLRGRKPGVYGMQDLLRLKA